MKEPLLDWGPVGLLSLQSQSYASCQSSSMVPSAQNLQSQQSSVVGINLEQSTRPQDLPKRKFTSLQMSKPIDERQFAAAAQPSEERHSSSSNKRSIGWQSTIASTAEHSYVRNSSGIRISEENQCSGFSSGMVLDERYSGRKKSSEKQRSNRLTPKFSKQRQPSSYRSKEERKSTSLLTAINSVDREHMSNTPQEEHLSRIKHSKERPSVKRHDFNSKNTTTAYSSMKRQLPLHAPEAEVICLSSDEN